MPNKAVPWLKLWPELVDHEKFAQLTDSESWTWVKALAKSGLQPTRGRYQSVQHAVVVTGRPKKHFERLIGVRLMDLRPDGLWMHDWERWQRWRPEDGLNDDGSPEYHPPNGTRSTRDEHANGAASAIDEHAMNTRTSTEGLSPLAPSSLSPRPPISLPPVPPEEIRDKSEEGVDFASDEAPRRLQIVGSPIPKPTPKPNPVKMLIDKIKALDPAVEAYGDHSFTGSKLKANPDADLDLLAEAYVSFRHGEWPGSKMLRESGALAWVIGDVGGYVAWRKQGNRRPIASRPGVRHA